MRVKMICAVCALAFAAVAGVSQANETITYTYDARGRLISVVHNGTVNDNLTSNYTFDDADNRKVLKVTGAPNSS